MIIKVCDRCKKQFYPIPGFMQAKLPSYSIAAVEGMFQRQIDLCDECQDDFDKWMKERLGKEQEDE